MEETRPGINFSSELYSCSVVQPSKNDPEAEQTQRGSSRKFIQRTMCQLVTTIMAWLLRKIETTVFIIVCSMVIFSAPATLPLASYMEFSMNLSYPQSCSGTCSIASKPYNPATTSMTPSKTIAPQRRHPSNKSYSIAQAS